MQDADGHGLKHLGTKPQVSYVNGEGALSIDYESVEMCNRPLIAVSERNDKGQTVVFGPSRQRIIKDPHVIKIIEAMQERIKPQKLKKEYWQNTHHELMESSTEKFTQIERGHEISYSCTKCFDTKLC